MTVVGSTVVINMFGGLSNVGEPNRHFQDVLTLYKLVELDGS